MFAGGFQRVDGTEVGMNHVLLHRVSGPRLTVTNIFPPVTKYQRTRRQLEPDVVYSLL